MIWLSQKSIEPRWCNYWKSPITKIITDVEIFYFIKPKYLKTYLTLVDNILNEHAYFKLLYICINITSPITKVVGFWEGITINPLENL